MFEGGKKSGKEKKSKKGAVLGLAALGMLSFGMEDAQAARTTDANHGFQAHMPAQTNIGPEGKLVANALTAMARYDKDLASAKSPDYVVEELSERDAYALPYAKNDFRAFIMAYNRSVDAAGGDADLVMERIHANSTGSVASEVAEVVNIMRHIAKYYSEKVRVRAIYDLLNEQDPADVGQ